MTADDLPGLPDAEGMDADDFRHIMSTLLKLQGHIDEAMLVLPRDELVINAVDYYERLAREMGLFDQHPVNMVCVAVGAVTSMRSVVASMHEDLVIEAEAAKYDD